MHTNQTAHAKPSIDGTGTSGNAMHSSGNSAQYQNGGSGRNHGHVSPGVPAKLATSSTSASGGSGHTPKGSGANKPHSGWTGAQQVHTALTSTGHVRPATAGATHGVPRPPTIARPQVMQGQPQPQRPHSSSQSQSLVQTPSSQALLLQRLSETSAGATGTAAADHAAGTAAGRTGRVGGGSATPAGSAAKSSAEYATSAAVAVTAAATPPAATAYTGVACGSAAAPAASPAAAPTATPAKSVTSDAAERSQREYGLCWCAAGAWTHRGACGCVRIGKDVACECAR
ncbi:hypothetical protein ACEPAF_7022 [Sanghuangporus sanghuang]